MKLARPSVFAVVLLLVAVVCSGCHHQRGWSSTLGTKIAKDDRSTDEFKKSLAEWLSRHGFTEASDPGGMVSWSGVHSAGEINSWYRGSYHGSPPFLLLVRMVPRKDAGGGFTEFHFSQSWDIAGSKRYLADMEALSEEFRTEFIRGLSLEEDDGSGP